MKTGRAERFEASVMFAPKLGEDAYLVGQSTVNGLMAYLADDEYMELGFRLLSLYMERNRSVYNSPDLTLRSADKVWEWVQGCLASDG